MMKRTFMSLTLIAIIACLSMSCASRRTELKPIAASVSLPLPIQLDAPSPPPRARPVIFAEDSRNAPERQRSVRQSTPATHPRPAASVPIATPSNPNQSAQPHTTLDRQLHSEPSSRALPPSGCSKVDQTLAETRRILEAVIAQAKENNTRP